ncbi:MAG: quinone-dependent dihydroorotate dehydrogenase [Burkholderiales bacterium]
MLYPTLHRFVAGFEPETVRHVVLKTFAGWNTIGLARLTLPAPPPAPRRVMGIDFPNPVGLAAGLDKNGEYIGPMSALGFGFIEIGTVTPRPQPGNPRPRLFLVPEHEGIINRLGFNNDGLDQLLRNVARSHFKGVLGINIGKNFDTPLERAHEDYVVGLRRVYAHASYVAVNISSPNTAGLRNLQNAEELDALLAVLKSEQRTLAAGHGRYVPIAVKIAPDLTFEQVDAVASLLLKHGMDGVIATNTTVSREGVEGTPLAKEAGGLSGAPLRTRATAILRRLCQALDGRLPVIGVGGILGGKDAVEKMEAGASLVQLYTGLVYRGPKLVREVVSAILEREGATARPNRLPT